MSQEHRHPAEMRVEAHALRARIVRLEMGAEIVDELLRLRAEGEGPQVYAAMTAAIERAVVVARRAP